MSKKVKPKKPRTFIPEECQCPNCCNTPADVRLARLERKRRLNGIKRAWKPMPRYKWRSRMREMFKESFAALKSVGLA